MKKELIAHREPKSPISEVFRTLRTNIQFMNTSKKLQSLLVTSTTPGEGKSWISANLAVTFAQAGKRVILVDADMRKGRQYTIFGALPKPGLSNYLSGIYDNDNEISTKNVTQYIQRTEVKNLCLMAAGNIPPNPSELLISSNMLKLLDELKQLADIVIIDGTPCELVTDSVILSRIVDSTVIVTAHEETKKESLQRVITSIQNVDGKIAGVVVNKVPISTKKYEQSYYYGSTDNKKNSSSKTTKKRNTKRANTTNSRKKKRIENKASQLYKEKELKEARERQRFEQEDEDDLSSYNKQDDILKEINEYLDKEKKKYGDM